VGDVYTRSNRTEGRRINMDVCITVTTGGGKKANRESRSVTIKEVIGKEQVTEVLDTKFKDYFPPQTRLTDEPVKKTQAKK
jgi:hypothetical protein